jgi:hypothetical protein
MNETEYHLARDRGANARNILDQAFEQCQDVQGKVTLFHAILHINGSSWLRNQDAFFE